jgi:hypothetical protein
MNKTKTDPPDLFTQRTPCKDCPFRIVNGIPITPGRAVEIMESDKLFYCHSTLDYANPEYNEDESESQAAETEHTKTCSGFMILMQKDPPQFGNQMLQIAERFGFYDPTALMKDNPAVAEIFDSREEMAKVCDNYRPSKKKGK